MPYMVNKRTGERVEVDQAGNPVSRNAGPPRDPTFDYKGPQAAAGLGQTQAATARTNVQTQGDQIDNRVKSALAPAQIAQAQAQAQKSQVDAAMAEFQRAHNGLSPDKVAEITGSLHKIDDLQGTVGDLRQQYNQNFKGGGLGALAEYLPSILRPANGVFNNTAGQLRGQIAQAQGLTSKQFDTPAEQKAFFEAFMPSSSDRDPQTEKKLDSLDRMANSGRANYMAQLGLPPINATPTQARSELVKALAALNGQIGQMPPQARQVGMQHFNNDPRIQALRMIAGSAGGPAARPARRAPRPGVIDFNDLP